MAEPSYVAEAFKLKPNLLFVGGGVAAAALFASPVVFGAVALAEVAYLATMSANPRFRRVVRSRAR